MSNPAPALRTLPPVLLASLVWLPLAACGDAMPAPAQDPSFVTGFSPPAAQAGYARFVAPPVLDLKPGTDVTYCQWLTDPAASDRMIADVTGYQSSGGHHFTLYATTIHEKIGTSRPCTDEDMLAVSFLGAIGGEGNGSNSVKLPPGRGFKLPKGSAIMANAHYLNASPQDIHGQSVADVKEAQPGETLQPVGFFVLFHSAFRIPAHTQGYTSTGSCTVPQKLSLFMWGNHLHEYGASSFSEVLRRDGSKVRLATDSAWRKEDTFNTPWQHWDMDRPLVLEAGDVVSVSCTWNNSTDAAVTFPREMCTPSGFVLEPIEQTICPAM